MLRAEFELTPDDYIAATRAFMRRYDPLRRWLLPVLGIAGGVILGAACYSWWRHPHAPPPYEALILGLVWLAAGSFYPDYALRRRFFRSGYAHRELILEADETGMRLTLMPPHNGEGGQEQQVTGWEQVSAAAESRRGLALLASGQIAIIPRRGFSTGDFDQLRNWLRSHRLLLRE